MGEQERWQVVVPARAELGERPVWDQRSGRMLWIDIMAGQLHSFAVAGDGTPDDQVIVDAGLPVGAAMPRQRGGYVLAAADGFRLTRADGISDGDAVRPADMGADVRFNDAYCDPAGRFWAGTVALDRRDGAGALYRLDADGTITEVLTGITESNGLGWSPDGETMYYIDSGEPRLRVRAFGFDAGTGKLGADRDLLRFEESDGISDGMIVDAEGCLWIAFWGGRQVRRYSPAGELLDRVHLPVSNPSCPGFGGPDLDRLYVTSAMEDLDEAQRAAEPLAGHVFLVRTDARGLPVTGYAG